MKWYNVKWHTHNNTAGGTGRVEAKDVDSAKEATREIVKEHNPLLTAEEIEKLIIEVEEG